MVLMINSNINIIYMGNSYACDGGNKVTMLVVMIIVVHNNDYNDINKNNQDNANNNNLNYQDINVYIKKHWHSRF